MDGAAAGAGLDFRLPAQVFALFAGCSAVLMAYFPIGPEVSRTNLM
ncbi:hypothetical protein [Nocardia flavorosea]|nr:hypothetical protein [Nocardia flavorosea]